MNIIEPINMYLLTLMQKIDTTAISAPKKTAQAIPSTAISKDPIDPSDDGDEPSVDGRLDFDEGEPVLLSDGDINV